LRFLVEIDNGRNFGGHKGACETTVTDTCLTWAANEGFSPVMRELGYEYRSAREFRERHIIRSLKQIAEALGGR
jgi:hypothetical protein